MKAPKVPHSRDGLKYKGLYVYMVKSTFFGSYRYFVSDGPIIMGYWISEKDLLCQG
jgi:hypothetical protein